MDPSYNVVTGEWGSSSKQYKMRCLHPALAGKCQLVVDVICTQRKKCDMYDMFLGVTSIIRKAGYLA